MEEDWGRITRVGCAPLQREWSARSARASSSGLHGTVSDGATTTEGPAVSRELLLREHVWGGGRNTSHFCDAATLRQN